MTGLGTGLLLAVTLFLTGCGTPSGGTNPPPAGAVTGAGAPPQGTNLLTGAVSFETLLVGEKLTITFLDPSGTPPFERKLPADGKITLLYDQEFDAVGKTVSELEKEIRTRYVPKYFTRLSIQIKTENQIFYVTGQVHKPDRYEYMSTMTVLKAVSAAGGFTDYAKRWAVEVTRADGTKILVDCKKAQRNPKLDVPINPGDRIYVPVRWL